MSQPLNEAEVHSATVTDRGLNERRPLNEDSFLDDNKRCIFAVADGVGGAEAGEVASKTAIEVLDEAFRHQEDGADIEDLMELAIQRANASIHRMSHEHAKLSMMATTIVALHLDGNTATIAHVGDSRLYRLSPEGQLLRETEDHSIVEEEVRAGRMTPQQAANHPSKNIISRALGAEDNVEVDLKTIEIEPGTSFLLCSDGITRHIPDHELRGVLLANSDLTTTCEELKRRCYDRGAEDNLTAVLIRVGEPSEAMRDMSWALSTKSLETVRLSDEADDVAYFAGNEDKTEDGLTPPSRIVFPAVAPSPAPDPSAPRLINIPDTASRNGGSLVTRMFFFLMFVVAAAGAFYAGTRYKGALPFGRAPEIPAVTQPTPANENPQLKFENARREVDRAPAEWLAVESPRELARQSIGNPLDSVEPQFLYLYGRALLLSGNTDEAIKAFSQVIARTDQSPTAENATIKKEATLALAAASLKANKEAQQALQHFDEIVTKPAGAKTP